MGIVVGGVVSRASAEPAPTGLAGLDDQLNTTGRIGVYAPTPVGQIAPAPTANDSAPRALALPIGERAEPDQRLTERGGLADEEFLPTETSVTACRVEVARRRQIPPKKVAAREVVVRFTVEPDGHVRDAEAISAPGTDLEIAACAKRVLSEWVFAKHPSGAVVAERTYRFR